MMGRRHNPPLFKLGLCLFLFFLCLALDASRCRGADAWENAITRFEPRSYQNAGGEVLRYRLLKPLSALAATTQTYPLILFLHGSGSEGEDNTKQLLNFAPEIATDEMMRRYPCYVVAPQLPDGARWVAIKWDDDRGGRAPEKPSRATRLTFELLAALKKEFPIDARRIYVTGLSMGGHGVWDMLWRKPELFAAAVPVCGGGDLSKARLFVHVPLWAFHGARDPVVPADRSRGMIAALRKAGGQPKYTEYPSRGHDAWLPAYRDPQLYEWLFAQSRREK